MSCPTSWFLPAHTEPGLFLFSQLSLLLHPLWVLDGPGWVLSLSHVHLQCLSVEGQGTSILAAFYRGEKENEALSNVLLLVRLIMISWQNCCLHKPLPHLSSDFLREATAQLSARMMHLHRYLRKGKVKKRSCKRLMLSTYQQHSHCSS